MINRNDAAANVDVDDHADEKPDLVSKLDCKFIPKILPATDTIEHANNAAETTKSILINSFLCRSKIIDDTASVFCNKSFNACSAFLRRRGVHEVGFQ